MLLGYKNQRLATTMRKMFGIITFIILTGNVWGQLPNLCGLWIGKGYQCYTIDTAGGVNLYGLDELVWIEQNGLNISATKITGDNCVNAGRITWQGDYINNSFDVSVVTGTPNSPSSGLLFGAITVITPTLLELSNSGGITFIKASCFQVDSLRHSGILINTSCIPCNTSPTVFTPNNDGINDFFLPTVHEQVKFYELSIFNRWGNLIFNSRDVKNGWDGMSNGVKCNDGNYFWIVNYITPDNKFSTIKGSVTIFN
jgi:gliding motility-associated-like protein